MTVFNVIVADASPLITLAAADALDKLTVPGLSLVIPDMVYYEVARDISKLGARELVDWCDSRPRLVEIAATETYAEFVALTTINSKVRTRNKGEESAIEVLRSRARRDSDFRGLLLFEDSDLLTRQFVIGAPARVRLLTTMDFLAALERAGKIQSADEIIDRAVLRGRNLRERGYDDPDLTTELARQWADQNGD